MSALDPLAGYARATAQVCVITMLEKPTGMFNSMAQHVT
jgi:hypothetical protein